MKEQFKGVVNVDVRDSVPDWAPYLQPKAPEGAPNVLMIVWDDVGYGAMDVFGGPIETPTMRRIADRGRAVRRTSTPPPCARRPARACSPAATRPATTWPCITEGAAGFPGFSARIPFENGTIAEVLNERGWNTYASASGTSRPPTSATCPSWKGRWPLGRGFERFYGFLGGETNQWYPGPHLRQPPGRAAVPARGRLPPLEGPGRQGRSSSSATPRRSRPTSRGSCTSRPGAGHAPHHVAQGVGGPLQGPLRRGLRGDPA